MDVFNYRNQAEGKNELERNRTRRFDFISDGVIPHSAVLPSGAYWCVRSMIDDIRSRHVSDSGVSLGITVTFPLTYTCQYLVSTARPRVPRTLPPYTIVQRLNLKTIHAHTTDYDSRLKCKLPVWGEERLTASRLPTGLSG